MKEINVTEARPEGCSDAWNEGRVEVEVEAVFMRGPWRVFNVIIELLTLFPISFLKLHQQVKHHGLQKSPGPPRWETR